MRPLPRPRRAGWRVKIRIGNLIDYIESIQTEATVASGTLAHHLLTNDLFHIDGLWIHVASGAEFHRWLSQGVNHVVTILLTTNPDRFADVKGVRILPGKLIHNTSPSAMPPIDMFYFQDPLSGTFGAVTLQTTDPLIVRKFAPYDDVDVNLVIKIN